MRQITFASQPSFEKYGRMSRREAFLTSMDTIVPWSELEALIAPFYPKAGKGRQPVGLGIMLRIYFLQHWFNLSDPGAEDALYESPVLRGFAGIDLGRAAAPDETTILNFRHLLEKHELNGKILDTVNLYLASQGIRISTGTIVDATIISAPCSTKNKKKVWGDAGYQGQTEAIHEAAPQAQDMTNRRVKKSKGQVDEEQKRKNRTKSRVRARVEWPFRILKRVFHYTKVRYRGIKKNHEWLLTAIALVNLYQHRKRLTQRLSPLGA